MSITQRIVNLQAKDYDGTDAYTHYCHGHRDARNRAAEIAAAYEDDVAKLLKAVSGVIEHMEGRFPVRGWLKDNDKSRAALAALVEAVGAV